MPKEAIVESYEPALSETPTAASLVHVRAALSAVLLCEDGENDEVGVEGEEEEGESDAADEAEDRARGGVVGGFTPSPRSASSNASSGSGGGGLRRLRRLLSLMYFNESGQ